MSQLVHHRCFVHATREAAARCPSCRQHFCRECVTEHDGRVLCASCLRKLTQPEVRRTRNLSFFTAPFQLLVGLALAWVVFYLVGHVLLQTPSEWHEGKAAEAAIIGLP